MSLNKYRMESLADKQARAEEVTITPIKEETPKKKVKKPFKVEKIVKKLKAKTKR